MSEITLEGVAAVIREELKLELDPISSRLDNVENTLNQHTDLLDSIAKDVKILLDDRIITTHRIERMEKVVKELALKAGLKLDW